MNKLKLDEYRVGDFLVSKTTGSVYRINRILISDKKLKEISPSIFRHKKQQNLNLDFLDVNLICTLFDHLDDQKQNKILKISEIFYSIMNYEYLTEIQMLECVNEFKLKICESIMRQ